MCIILTRPVFSSERADRKIIVVTGGVLSGIGKGVTASSMGVVSDEIDI